MDRVETSPSESTTADPTPLQPTAPAPAGAEGHHDFEAQKRIHQQIRNDPDYDDWEYGTEPLPHEAWSTARSKGQAPPASTEAP